MKPHAMNVFKRYAKSLFFWLFLCSLAIAWAGGDADQPAGQPPFGLKVEGETKGTKLDGVVSIEFFGCESLDPGTICDATIALRLRQGNTSEPRMFVAGILDVNSSSPLAVQVAITDALGPQVVNSFFPGKSLTTHLKDITQFVKKVEDTSIFVLADVQIAVN